MTRLFMTTKARTIRLGAAVVAVAVSFLAGTYVAVLYRTSPKVELGVTGAAAAPDSLTEEPKAGSPGQAADSIELSESQLKFVKVETIGERDFPIEKTAVGSIDFNEEMVTQVFTPYQGRIVGLFAKIGDEVKKGQTLFTIDSPDLLQASSTLISAAGVLELTTRNLDRLKMLFASKAASQKDVEQATSDQQTAQANYRAARDAVRIFGKTDAEIDKIVAERHVDPILVVPSPIGVGSPPATRRRDFWSNLAIRRRPILSPIFRRCGCSPMSPKPIVPPLPLGSRSRSQ